MPAPARSDTRLYGAALVLTCGLIAALAAWRLHGLTLGPDPDTDAYGHYVIARQLLETPLNLHIHWVWLPVYHVVLAALVSAGVTLDGVRSANAVLATFPALLLLWGLGRARLTPTAAERAVPLLAAVLATNTPILNQMGTTAQMEVLFSIELLAAALLLSRERHGWAACVLSLAALTRYEAWAAVAAIAVVLAHRSVVSRSWPRLASALCVLGPAFGVVLWAGLRASQAEPWFGFIGANQAFAEGALHQTRASADWLLRALARYPLTMPALSFGVGALFALFGLRRTLRHEGIWFVVIPLSTLAFLMSSALSRSHLGLDRHFLPLVPFVATWIAHGVARVSEWLSRPLAALVRGEHIAFGLGFAAFGLAAIYHQQTVLRSSLASWRETTERALPRERAAGRFLASLPASALVVCDEASVEVLSELPRSRILRLRVGPPLIPPLKERALKNDLYVMSRSARVQAVSELGPLVYADADRQGYAALHVNTPASGDSRLSAGTLAPP